MATLPPIIGTTPLLVRVAPDSIQEAVTGQMEGSGTGWAAHLGVAIDTRCPNCEGSGRKQDQYGHALPCRACKGQGEAVDGQ